jgi:zinc D-Ala-D-Ala carboxypeptidase
MDDTRLSPNFTLAELTFSEVALRLGFDNEPPAALIPNLQRLCQMILEPARTLLNVPLHVNSGYRSHELNAAIGGATDSAHMYCRAADILPIGMPLLEAFEKLRTSAIAYDQIIVECGAWIHIAIAMEDAAPRRQALTASGRPGNWHYEAVA